MCAAIAGASMADPVAWTFAAGGDYTEELAWLTDLLQAPTGGTQHRRLRQSPRTTLTFSALESGANRRWMDVLRHVKLPLHKYLLESGERRVRVADDGKASHTVFRLLGRWQNFSLLEAELKTGRTHQIRVHLAHLGYPIAGDEKYGDFALNRKLQKAGLKRMFLHAWKIRFSHPLSGDEMQLEAPLPTALESFVLQISNSESQDYGQEFRSPGV